MLQSKCIFSEHTGLMKSQGKMRSQVIIFKTETNKKNIPGLPWWRSGWESACQCRGHGFEPWSWKIPRAAEQLSLGATTAEPTCHNY